MDGGGDNASQARPRCVDGAWTHVGNALMATNNALAAAAAKVVHGVSGGKVSEEEVTASLHGFGNNVERAVRGVFQPPRGSEDFLAGVDPSLQAHLSATISSQAGRQGEDAELLEAIRRSMEDFKGGAAATPPEPPEPPPARQRAAPFPAGEVMHFSHVDPRQAQQIREQRTDTLLVSEAGVCYFDEEAKQLMLPDMRAYPREMRAMVLHSVVSGRLQSAAESRGAINTSPACSRQYVLHTMGDGNCLSHACSLGVWGVHDRDKQLRHAIQGTMAGDSAAGRSIRERFQQQLAQQGSPPSCWQTEWQLELDVFRDDRRYLGDVHCFTLANVLRRPVLIYGDATALMGGLCGVYLPLLWAPQSCSPTPITVLYNESHFSLLCVIEGEAPAGGVPCVQLASAGEQPLPVRFALPGEEPAALLRAYMAVREAPDGSLAAMLGGAAADNVLVSLMAAVMRS
mmetsp:Transcript_37663/g.97736  ORF Transcript_37663/g.97736 Transcript_37663/m.97736 type:complete len:457 (+) Transcript_37663:322-1692(+)